MIRICIRSIDAVVQFSLSKPVIACLDIEHTCNITPFQQIDTESLHQNIMQVLFDMCSSQTTLPLYLGFVHMYVNVYILYILVFLAPSYCTTMI